LIVDHYASLGVSRTSEDVVIRAAYRALMRRYHPDTNGSPEAAERVREISAAYGVLGDKDRRREYDNGWDPDQPTGLAGTGRKPPPVGPIAFGITILCVSMLIWIIWAQQRPGRDPSSPAEAQLGQKAHNGSQTEISCSSIPVTKLVRRELFDRVAEVRGTERMEFEQLAEKLVVRTTPVPLVTEPSPGFVSCSVAIIIELPEGISDRHGRRALSGNGDYFIDPDGGADSVLIRFSPDQPLLTDLASLEMAGKRPVDTEFLEVPATVRSVPKVAQARSLKRPAPLPLVRNASEAVARPKPAQVVTRIMRKSEVPVCRGDRWTALICGDKNLGALDQQLAVFERQSSTHADAKKRDRLQKSRTQFENERTACRTEACVRRALVGRTSEVAEIMREKSSPERQ
jgi:hypothetical protein